jgi:hypothetical protein
LLGSRLGQIDSDSACGSVRLASWRERWRGSVWFATGGSAPEVAKAGLEMKSVTTGA